MLERLQDLIREFFDDKNVIITGDTILLTDLGLNSYELVQMVVEVEEAFGIEIPDRAIGGFKTVQDVIDYIAALKEAIDGNGGK